MRPCTASAHSSTSSYHTSLNFLSNSPPDKTFRASTHPATISSHKITHVSKSETTCDTACLSRHSSCSILCSFPLLPNSLANVQRHEPCTNMRTLGYCDMACNNSSLPRTWHCFASVLKPFETTDKLSSVSFRQIIHFLFCHSRGCTCISYSSRLLYIVQTPPFDDILPSSITSTSTSATKACTVSSYKSGSKLSPKSILFVN